MNNELESLSTRLRSYQYLQKDVSLVKYFLKRRERKIRQQTIIDHFNDMSAKTVREHLYGLVERGVIDVDSKYRGTYIFNPYGFREFAVDMDLLIKSIVGREIYDIAVSIWKEKNNYKDSESNEKNGIDSYEDTMDNEPDEYLEDYL